MPSDEGLCESETIEPWRLIETLEHEVHSCSFSCWAMSDETWGGGAERGTGSDVVHVPLPGCCNAVLETGTAVAYVGTS